MLIRRRRLPVDQRWFSNRCPGVSAACTTSGRTYQDARRSLEAKVDQELSRLTPEEREAVQKNIEVIRSAIRDINRALAEEPDNALLQKLLLSAYREELDPHDES